jgi:pyruvate,water dikinase
MKLQHVGGKFHRQSKMIRAGLNVPPFFCLSAAFYERLFAPIASKVAGILKKADLTDIRELDRTSAEIRNLFTGVGLSEKDERAILRAFDTFFPQDELVSVRASMVAFTEDASEDSVKNPFAGMSESFLYVPKNELIEKILQCASSGFKREALLYRYKQSLDPIGFSVAVGVQKMVLGSRSFVLFTCNPTTSARETLVTAGHGIGEGVVQEKVAVDHFFFNPTSKQIRKRVVEKEEMLGPGHAGHGITSLPVPDALRSAPCLTDLEVVRLSETGLRIERLFKAPQDIEGTITPDGVVHILQSRPIAIDSRNQRVWSNANITESYPGVSTPLTYSVARQFYRVVFRDCYRRLGIPAADLQDLHESLDRMIGFLGGRIYYCLTSIYRLHRQSPLFPLYRPHWEKLVGFQSSYEIDDVRSQSFGRINAILRLATATVRILWSLARNEHNVRHFHAWWNATIDSRRGRKYDDVDPLLIIADFHHVWSEVGNRWGTTLMNDVFLTLAYPWTLALLRRWQSSEALLTKLLCSDETMVSVEIILSAVRLAEHVRGDRSLSKLFQEHGPEQLASMLEADELPPDFTAKVKSHLQLYGDRGFQELKMEQPNLRDTPWLLFKMVQGYIQNGMTADDYRARERALQVDAEKELAQLCRRHPGRKIVLGRAARWLRSLIRNRENSRYCRSELYSYTKNALRGVASTLVRDGDLDAIDDIYYLTLDEIFGFLDGTGVTENLRGLVAIRRKEYAANQKLALAQEITTWGPLRRNDIFAVDDECGERGVLRGLGSSAGRVTGIARLVLDPSRFTKIGENEILIARETDPGWLYLMLSAKAMVVERGSMLSHTAITGRKFCIPTVVSVPEATLRIPDGSLIEVDGGSGLVRILEPGSEVQEVHSQ